MESDIDYDFVFTQLRKSHAQSKTAEALAASLIPLLSLLEANIKSTSLVHDIENSRKAAREAWNICIDASNRLSIKQVASTSSEWSDIASIRGSIFMLSKSLSIDEAFDSNSNDLLLMARSSAQAWIDLKEWHQAERVLSSCGEFSSLPLDLQLLHLNLMLQIDSPAFSTKAQQCYEECAESDIGRLAMRFLEMGIAKAEATMRDEADQEMPRMACIKLISLASNLLDQVSQSSDLAGPDASPKTWPGHLQLQISRQGEPPEETLTPQDITEGKVMALTWMLFLNVKQKDGPNAVLAYDMLRGIDVSSASDPLIIPLSILAKAMVPQRAEGALQDLIGLASSPASEGEVMSLVNDLLGVSLSVESLMPAVQLVSQRLHSSSPIVSFALMAASHKHSKKEDSFVTNLLIEAVKLQQMVEGEERDKLRIATFNRAVVFFNRSKHNEAISLWKTCALICDEPAFAELKSTCLRHACLSSLASEQSHESCLDLLDQSDQAVGGRPSMKTSFFRFKIILGMVSVPNKDQGAAGRIVQGLRDCADFDPSFLEAMYQEASECNAWSEVREILALLYSTLSQDSNDGDCAMDGGGLKEGRVLWTLIHSILEEEKGGQGSDEEQSASNRVELARWYTIASKRLESLGLESFLGSSEDDVALITWMASSAYNTARSSSKAADYKSSTVILGAAALFHKVLFALDLSPSSPHKLQSVKVHLLASSSAIEVFLAGGPEGSLTLASSLFKCARIMDANTDLKQPPSLLLFLSLVLSLLEKDWAGIEQAVSLSHIAAMSLPQLCFILNVLSPDQNQNLTSIKLWGQLSHALIDKEMSQKSPNLILCASILVKLVTSAKDDAKVKSHLLESLIVLSQAAGHQPPFPLDPLKVLVIRSWNLAREKTRGAVKAKGAGMDFALIAIDIAYHMPPSEMKKEWIEMMEREVERIKRERLEPAANKEHQILLAE